MEKKRLSNYFLLVSTIIIVLVILITKTVVIMSQRHEDKAMYSMRTKIEYNAKRCYLEEKCTDTITLQKLYDEGYINEEVINPITKEVINHDLEIKYDNDRIVINW